MTASQSFGKSCIPDKTPSLLSCLITRVTSVEASSIVTVTLLQVRRVAYRYQTEGEEFLKWIVAQDLFHKLKKTLRGERFATIEEASTEVTRVIRQLNSEGVLSGIQDLPKRWEAVIRKNGDYIEGL